MHVKFPSGWLMVVFITFLSVHHAMAAIDEEFMGRLKNCKVIKSLVTRSQCYDVAIDDYDLDTLAKTAAGPTGKWKVTLEKSPISDMQNSYVSLVGNNYYPDKKGGFIRPSMVVRCAEGKTEMYTIWDTDVGNVDPDINLRVGSLPVVAFKGVRSGDNQSTFIANPEETLKQMVSQDTLFVKVWPQLGDTIEVTFDIRGLAVAAKPLRDTCKW